MKSIRFIFLLLSLSLIFSSCLKDNSTISGTVNYFIPSLGTEFPASGAVVGLYLDQSLTNVTTTTTCNASGVFSMSGIEHGTYFLHSEIEIDSVKYIHTGEIEVKRNSLQVHDLILY